MKQLQKPINSVTNRNAFLLFQPGQRMMVLGKSRSGKTTAVVNFVNKYLRRIYVNINVISPTYQDQNTFDCIRDVVTKYYPSLNNKVMESIVRELRGIKNCCKTKGVEPMNNLIIIDDMSGTSSIHGNRKGAFANFSVITPHLNASTIMISHNPTNVDPNFRDNAEHVILFHNPNGDYYDWARKSYGSKMIYGVNFFDKIYTYAMRGGLTNNEEVGKHYLHIYNPGRGNLQFFMDSFEYINPEDFV